MTNGRRPLARLGLLSVFALVLVFGAPPAHAESPSEKAFNSALAEAKAAQRVLDYQKARNVLDAYKEKWSGRGDAKASLKAVERSRHYGDLGQAYASAQANADEATVGAFIDLLEKTEGVGGYRPLSEERSAALKLLLPVDPKLKAFAASYLPAGLELSLKGFPVADETAVRRDLLVELLSAGVPILDGAKRATLRVQVTLGDGAALTLRNDKVEQGMKSYGLIFDIELVDAGGQRLLKTAHSTRTLSSSKEHLGRSGKGMAFAQAADAVRDAIFDLSSRNANRPSSALGETSAKFGRSMFFREKRQAMDEMAAELARLRAQDPALAGAWSASFPADISVEVRGTGGVAIDATKVRLANDLAILGPSYGLDLREGVGSGRLVVRVDIAKNPGMMSQTMSSYPATFVAELFDASGTLRVKVSGSKSLLAPNESVATASLGPELAPLIVYALQENLLSRAKAGRL